MTLFNNSSPNRIFCHYYEYHAACAFYVSSTKRIRVVLSIMAEFVIWRRRIVEVIKFSLHTKTILVSSLNYSLITDVTLTIL